MFYFSAHGFLIFYSHFYFYFYLYVYFYLFYFLFNFHFISFFIILYRNIFKKNPDVRFANRNKKYVKSLKSKSYLKITLPLSILRFEHRIMDFPKNTRFCSWNGQNGARFGKIQLSAGDSTSH